jgi:hypothetical protein
MMALVPDNALERSVKGFCERATQRGRWATPESGAIPLTARICALFVATLLALPAPCVAQALGRLDVVMKPFEAVGEADPEFAKSLWQQLAQAIERKSDFRIALGGSAYYYLEGQLLADEKRHLVTLQLFKAKTDRTLWLGNYDYRRTTADSMATDVIAALSSVPSTDTWN